MLSVKSLDGALPWERNACLFVGYVERTMLEDYKGNKPQLYKHYIDDVLWASSGARKDLDDFIEFCSAYHPSLKYTFEMSESSVSFLALCLSIPDARNSDAHPLQSK